MEIFIQSLKHALTITSFVFGMMLFIDYINVLTGGKLDLLMKGKKSIQYAVTSFLGATPGCLGAFMNVSFYIHGVITFGALVGGMIATTGDDAFVMLSLFPGTAVILFGILFVLGIVGGVMADKLAPLLKMEGGSNECRLYEEKKVKCDCRPLGLKEILAKLRNPSFARFLLVFIIAFFIYAFVSGIIGPQEWDWERITFVLVLTLAGFIVVSVPEQYLEEHVWKHIAKEHTARIFLWSFAALLILNVGLHMWNLEDIIKANILGVLFISVLVGIIPQSGPHLIFVVMFSKGLIPFSVLLASSIVQDGHGMLPLLSCSVKDSVRVKLFNVIFGLIFGLALYIVGL